MKLRAIIISLALLAFLTASAGGLFYHYSMRESVLAETNKDVAAQMDEIAERIKLHFKDFQKIAAAMAAMKEIKRAFSPTRPGGLEEANAVLDQFQRALDADVCFLIDRSGKAVASSNRDTPESFVGTNYAFRPYFQEAMQGNSSAYPALGVRTMKRGVFYSHPVYAGEDGVPAGVVVIKKSIDYLDREMSDNPDEVRMLVNSRGVIFVSSRRDWLFHVLWKTSPGALADIAATRQFGGGPFAWTGLERMDAQHARSSSGAVYLFHHRRLVGFPEWEIVYLIDRGLISRRTSALFFTHYGSVIVSFCVVIGAISILLYSKASREIVMRRRAEEELRSMNDRMQALIKSSPLPIVIGDRKGNTLLWNPAAEKMFGWNEQEAAGKPMPIVPEDKRDEFNEVLLRTLNGESFGAVETQRLRKDGTRVSVSLSTAPLHDARGDIQGGIGIYQDITDRRKAEDERLKGHMLESIGLLAGGISHDFNNLLTVITGNIRLAKMSLTSGDASFSRLSDAEQVCGIAGELTRRLTSFATGGDNPRAVAPLQRLIAETVGIALTGSDISLVTDLPDNLPPVAVDEVQIKQVFRNLAINAKEAMPDGGTLTIQGESLPVSSWDALPIKEGHYLRITVRDTGVGIAEENLARIFDPYYSTKDNYSQRGLGLGLAVCYAVIKRHDGLITVESEVGKGTAYIIYLPAAGAPPQPT